MKKLAMIFKVLYIICLATVTGLYILAIVLMLLSEKSLWLGVVKTVKAFNPFNVTNIIALITYYMPAFIFYRLYKRCDKQPKEVSHGSKI